MASIVLLRLIPPPVGPGPDVTDPDVAMMELFTTPAYAQGTGISTLPPVDRLDFSRLVPGRLVYRHAEGADGIITQQSGTDTIRIARDTVDGAGRIVLVRSDRAGNKSSGMSGLGSVDSLALSSDGHLLFWHWKLRNVRVPSHSVTMNTTLLPDSVRWTYQRQDDAAAKSHTLGAGSNFRGRSVLVPMLPALPLERGYARSVSLLDLLGGETTPAFSRSLELRVTGREWVSVPAGRFDCWVVEYAAVPEPGERRSASLLYVDVASGVLVRAEWSFGSTFYGEQVLIRR
jgi:hypothetical protein